MCSNHVPILCIYNKTQKTRYCRQGNKCNKCMHTFIKLNFLYHIMLSALMYAIHVFITHSTLLLVNWCARCCWDCSVMTAYCISTQMWGAKMGKLKPGRLSI